MAFICKITNLLNQKIITNYRMPRVDAVDSVKNNPFLSVEIQPRAMFNDVIFASSAHYNEWKRQNQSLFDRGILAEGEILNEKKILAENERLTQEAQSTSKDKIDKNIDKLQESADNLNAGLEFEAVISEADRKPRNRRKRN